MLQPRRGRASPSHPPARARGRACASSHPIAHARARAPFGGARQNKRKQAVAPREWYAALAHRRYVCSDVRSFTCPLHSDADAPLAFDAQSSVRALHTIPLRAVPPTSFLRAILIMTRSSGRTLDSELPSLDHHARQAHSIRSRLGREADGAQHAARRALDARGARVAAQLDGREESEVLERARRLVASEWLSSKRFPNLRYDVVVRWR